VKSGLPDGLFSDHKSQFWFIFVGLGMENLEIFYGHFGIFKSIRCSLPPFGTFCGILVYIFPLWYVEQEQSGNPG
jgi:hypothetical protein